jgi:DNA polymerase I-like protein with 3'-5' exonuclease and polymerase domains
VDLRFTDTLTEIVLHCQKKNISAVICTQISVLKKLSGREKPSLDNFAGSLFTYKGIEFVFVPPLAQLVSVNYGPFLFTRYISKVGNPDAWRKATPFVWSICDPSNIADEFAYLESAIAIAVDIETIKEPLAIKEIGFTAILGSTELATRSIVIDLTNTEDAEFMWAWIRRILSLPIPKIFQNGKYDIAYLSRFGASVSHYFYDPKNFFHCYYCELPKDLAFINAFFVRESVYWKDMGGSADKHTRLEYNARDTWATANAFIAALLELPDWAINNYILEFPTVFPCHLAEMTGMKQNEERRAIAEKSLNDRIAEKNAKLAILTDTPNINVNSAPQMTALRTILGCGDLDSSDETNLKKMASRHPINKIIGNLILDIRGDRKIVSTYLNPEKIFKGRILYTLNPDGTDSGRLASREHHFWTGMNIQNQPAGSVVRNMYEADEGFLFGSCDLEQAESRDTAHISGDETLIAAVSSTRDFHSVNASAFFGIPYDELYDDEHHKTKNKPLRDLSKRINHGVTYNMGADVLLDTMGEEQVIEARELLRLPKLWSLTKVCEHLLSVFHKTYKSISRVYYPAIVNEVLTTHKLTSRVTNYLPWTRYCFGRPKENKRDLNALIAHPPQSLNAMTLNRAWIKVFREVWIPNKENFKLCAQIHDEILFQYREGHEHLAHQVKKCMEIPTRIIGYDGVEREFVVPASLSYGKKFWGELK